MKTVVYIDGYNLYYGLLRKTEFKWLDVFSLFQDHVLPTSTEVVQIRYYTAPILQRMSDDPLSPQRQRAYLQALRKFRANSVEIIEGKMVRNTRHLRLATPIPEVPHIELVKVFDFTEKKTDVSIAVDMINDAWSKQFDQAVLCSNDTDLQPVLSNLKKYQSHLRIGLVAPVTNQRHIAGGLIKHVDWYKSLSPVHLAASQLPNKIPHTSIKRPEPW